MIDLLNKTYRINDPIALKDLLQAYGVNRIIDLAVGVHMTKQQAFVLWTGRVGIGKKTMDRIHRAFGVPYEDLHRVPTPFTGTAGPKRKKPLKQAEPVSVC